MNHNLHDYQAFHHPLDHPPVLHASERELDFYEHGYPDEYYYGIYNDHHVEDRHEDFAHSDAHPEHHEYHEVYERPHHIDQSFYADHYDSHFPDHHLDDVLAYHGAKHADAYFESHPFDMDLTGGVDRESAKLAKK